MGDIKKDVCDCRISMIDHTFMSLHAMFPTKKLESVE